MCVRRSKIISKCVPLSNILQKHNIYRSLILLVLLTGMFKEMKFNSQLTFSRWSTVISVIQTGVHMPVPGWPAARIDHHGRPSWIPNESFHGENNEIFRQCKFVPLHSMPNQFIHILPHYFMPLQALSDQSPTTESDRQSSKPRTPSTSSFHKKKEKKEKLSVLKNVTTHFRISEEKGRLIAIMGPSGCGKTTFLNILTGRKVDECIQVGGRHQDQWRYPRIFSERFPKSCFQFHN